MLGFHCYKHSEYNGAHRSWLSQNYQRHRAVCPPLTATIISLQIIHKLSDWGINAWDYQGFQTYLYFTTTPVTSSVKAHSPNLLRRIQDTFNGQLSNGNVFNSVYKR